MKLLSILLVFSLITPAFADQSTYLDKGAVAPYPGFLLDHEKAGKVRLLSIDLEEAVKTRDYLTKDNEVYVKRLENMTTQNDKLATQLADARDTSLWSKLGLFILGAATTTLIVYGTSRVTK